MKKFKFSLDTVLNYKYQILEELKRDHSLIISAITQKETEISALEDSYSQKKHDFNAEKEKGMSIIDALSHQSHIHILLHNIKKEHESLEKLHIEEKAKTKEVIASKIETASFEKLKERRINEYNEMVQKFEERFIEDFISNKSISQKTDFKRR